MTDSAITELDSDDSGMSFRQIMNMLVEKQEIILTINKDDVPLLKRRLTVMKSRDSSKLKNSGIEPGDGALSYIVLPPTDPDADPNDVRIHIRLAPRNTIVVKKVEVADDNI